MKKQEKIALMFLIVIAVVAMSGVYVKSMQFEEEQERAKEVIQKTNQDEQVDTEKASEVSSKAVELRYIGEFKITAYCSCEKCCGKWAKNRPTDKEGNKVVYTASGAVATPGQTVAVDPEHIPYGTRLLINGQEYIAQDTGSAVNGNVIDIYFNSHEEAENWDCQLHPVYLIQEVD